MNKLFLITWRWLLRDKRRTALTFASIVLAVYLISFVGFYMSTALTTYHAVVEYHEPHHASLILENIEQAKKLDNNVSWESHLTKISPDGFMISDFAHDHVSSSESLFPLITINGKSIFEDKHDLQAVMISGDVKELTPKQEYSLDGEMPKHAGEVAVSKEFAGKYGDVGIGDTLTIKYDTYKGTLYCAKTDENNQLIKDSDGGLIYCEDKLGLKLRQLYGAIQYDSYELVKLFNKLYSVENGNDKPVKSVFSYNNYEFPPAYAVLSDECTESFEYTAKVTGIISSSMADIAFCIDDNEIMPYFKDSPVDYIVRVKKGLDAEQCCKKALKTFGLDNDDDTNLYVNSELLILEGRQLEYVANIGPVFAVAAIIMGIFVFLSRLIINNAFEISAAYRTEQYGALKTIGASDKQIFTMIMFECGLYLLTALPLGFLIALAVGRILLAKVRDIGLYDLIVGEAANDSFFKFELSPLVMVITLLVAAFSIFFSSYADAMRVRRMPPIQSVGYGQKKRAKTKKSRWFSRRLLGYPRGFAIKCISKQKVRFAVTLTASVMSGIFIMTFACLVETYSNRHTDTIDRCCDISASHWESGFTLESVKKDYEELKASGYFEEIIPNIGIGIGSYKSAYDKDAPTDPNEKCYSDKYLEYYNDPDCFVYDRYLMNVSFIARESFEKHIHTDMTYDEFLKSGKPLVCNTVSAQCYDDIELNMLKEKYNFNECYQGSYGITYAVLDFDMFKENTDELVFKGELIDYDDDKTDTIKHEYTENVRIGGFYTTDQPDFMFSGCGIQAIMPYELAGEDIFEFQKIELKDPSPISIRFYYNGADYYIKDGCANDAISLIYKYYDSEDDNIEDFIENNEYREKIGEVIKVAIGGFAVSLAAVVLLSIFSTMRANVINRRRDFSMMRSCGMSLKQVRKSLFFEARIYAFITTLISSLIGIVVALFIYYAFFESGEFGSEMMYTLMPKFPWQVSVGIYITIMIVMAAAFVPALVTMKKENIAEEIRTDI